MASKGMSPTVTVKDQTFLTFAEVARRTSVSGDTVRNWVKKKQLTTSLVKGRQMVSAEVLEEFLRPKAVEPGVLIPGLGRKVDEKAPA